MSLPTLFLPGPALGLLIAGTALIGMLGWRSWRAQQLARRREFIRHYRFPPGLMHKLLEAHPQLTLRDAQLVGQGLRQFFLAHLNSGRQFVAMPSQVADDLWHQLILYTRHYDQFCRQAFGRFMHHTPAVALAPQRRDNTGLRRCWYWCCKDENIHPDRPSRLPLLFALDAKFAVANGFRYAPDCSALRERGDGSVYCGGDIGGGGDGGDGGSAGSWSDVDGSGGHGSSHGGHGGDGSDGGGDGGGSDGCGGGCGGGGD